MKSSFKMGFTEKNLIETNHLLLVWDKILGRANGFAERQSEFWQAFDSTLNEEYLQQIETRTIYDWPDWRFLEGKVREKQKENKKTLKH